jgi:peptidoglycan-associated lipoprotein
MTGNIMKTEKLFRLAVVTLMVGAVAAGCTRRPQNTTPLLGSRAGFTDRPGGPIDPAAPMTGDIPASNVNFDNTIADHETFRDSTVYFAFDQATVRPSEVSKLERVASQMRSHVGKLLRIEGHCDERGTEEYNRSLGERRAQSVREQLARLGMDPAIIQTITFGEERPALPGHDESAWSKNRRGEIILLTPTTATAQGGTQ